jgi:hypothetical protein
MKDRGLLRFRAVLAAVLLSVSFPAPSSAVTAGNGWTYVGSGPLAVSTALSASAQYPAGVEPGDLLFMSCQGRRNTMRWSAPGWRDLDLDFFVSPQVGWGPPGLRHQIHYRWAAGDGSAVTVQNTTGVNGWSCVISAFRGPAGQERMWMLETLTNSPLATKLMSPGGFGFEGDLHVGWYVSRDDNRHGRPSYGTLAYGGTAYDTTAGADHAVSMAYYITHNPALGMHTMRQLANGPDPWMTYHIILRPVP